MGLAVSRKQWAALRALRDGEFPTFDLLAAAAGLHPVTLRAKASRAKWPKRLPGDHNDRGVAPPAEDDVLAKAADGLPDAAAGELPAGDVLLAEVERVLAEAGSGRVNKARIDAVLSMIRIVERTEQFRRPPKGEDDAANEKTRSDDKLAELLARVDARIVELARCHAERLGGAEPDGRRG